MLVDWLILWLIVLFAFADCWFGKSARRTASVVSFFSKCTYNLSVCLVDHTKTMTAKGQLIISLCGDVLNRPLQKSIQAATELEREGAGSKSAQRKQARLHFFPIRR